MVESNTKYIECSATRLYLLEDYINTTQCKSLIYSINKIGQKQNVVCVPEIAQELWEYIGPKISEQIFFDAKRNFHFNIVNISNHITITNDDKPTRIHRDMTVDHKDTFKLAFYLNEIAKGGGTIFYDDTKNFDDNSRNIIVKNKPGSGILFDLSLLHKGQDFTSNQNKMMIGARPIINVVR